MKTILVLATGLSLLALSNTLCFGAGTLVFANNTATRITNCITHLPQSNTVYVGLYFTPDLSAVSNQSALASMLLAGVPKLLPFVSSAGAYGRFNGGNTTLPGTADLQPVVAQVKAWPTNFPTFELARANGADVAESLPWVQTTGGGFSPPTMISYWGFRPFLYPQCEPMRVPLIISRLNASTIRMDWPVGVPPALQFMDGTSTNWQALTSGTFVQDHWEFQIQATNGIQLFRLAQ